MPGKNIRLSACTASYGHADLFDVIDRAAQLGLDGVEITVMYHLPADSSPAHLADVRSKLDDAGIAASALHFIFPGNLSFIDPSAAARRDVALHIARIAEMASAVGAEAVMVGGGGIRSYTAETNRSAAEERVLGIFDLAATLADNYGVSLAFEALNRYETNIGNTLKEVQELILATGNRTLGIGGDTFHMNIEERDLGDAIQSVGPDLKHLHLADSHRLAPGEGHIDFGRLLTVLDDVDYQGWMSMELFAIAPGLMYLPTFELCDSELRKGAAHIRQLQASEPAVAR